MPNRTTYPPASRRSERLKTEDQDHQDQDHQDQDHQDQDHQDQDHQDQDHQDQDHQDQDHQDQDHQDQDHQDQDHQGQDKMADAAPNLHAAGLEELDRLREEIARLRAERDTPNSRRSTTVDSAFGGMTFTAKGMAALPAFRTFTGVDGANPRYDRKEKARANDPPKFRGDKALFDNWVHKVADKFEEDEPIFRTERSRMRYLMSLLEGAAEKSVEARHQSTTRPFSCLAEMIQVLAAAYHDPNQATAARTALLEHHYDPRKNNDIHTFIADFNTLAMKARIPEDQWKANLWDHIPPKLDSRLLQDAEDEDISYEEFCDRVARAAYSTQRDYDLRQKERRSREIDETSGSRPRRDNGKGWHSSKPASKPKTSSDTGRALSAAEKKVHWDANTCFNCGKTGHQAAGCPRKKEIATVEVGSSSSSDESGKE